MRKIKGDPTCENIMKFSVALVPVLLVALCVIVCIIELVAIVKGLM